MSEEQKELTDEQKRAKEILDEELALRKKSLQATITALDTIDTEAIARKMTEKKEETTP